MALDIGQIAAVSYPAVRAEMRKAENQWLDKTLLDTFEKKGFIQHVSFGDDIQIPLDYRVNPDTAVLVTDQDEHALLDQQIVTAASFSIAQASVPVVWTKMDEVKNPEENQKISLVKQKLENGINSHDDLMEQCFFTSSTAGGVEVLGFNTLIPENGQGTVGGINAGAEAWWENWSDQYTDVTDIEATMTEAWNEVSKGSGSSLVPTLLVGGAEAHAMYEAQLQTFVRFNSTAKGDGAFRQLAFKSADFVFSQYGDDHIYFLNPKSYQCLVSKQYFRDKDNTIEIPAQNAFVFKIYSAMQNVVSNKSRLAVIYI